MVSPFRGSGPFRGRGPFLGRGPWAGKAPWGFNLGGVAWTPATLFASGEVGAWYDPSDLNTLWQDSAGTTPVTAVEQPVGLMLDKSKGLTLGPDTVTNGDFALSTDWTNVVAGQWTFTGGFAATTAGSVAFYQDGVMTVGRWYRVSMEVSNYAGGSGVAIYSGKTATPPAAPSVASIAGNGALTAYILASDTAICVRSGSGTTSCRVDNISVRELAGNHAFNPNATTVRPTLSARYNLLTYSEQFDNAAWTKVGTATVAASATAAPDGTTTAWRLQCPASGDQIQNAASIPVAANYIGSIWMRSRTGVTQTVKLSIAGNQTASVGTEWARYVTIPLSLGAGSRSFVVGYSTSAVDIDIWHPDVRAESEPGSVSNYQRVTTATDYDATPGTFPYYLSFDGVSDWLQTASIDFTATDKMSVFAGVRKLNTTAAFNTLLEFGTTGANGIGIFAPDSNNNTYAFWLKGKSRPTAGNYIAPITNVFTVQHDCAGISSALQTQARINGASVALSTSDPGSIAAAGNFANEALYIGRRAGSSLPFNGRLYSLTVLGRTATAAEIASAETYVAAKTGVVLP